MIGPVVVTLLMMAAAPAPARTSLESAAAAVVAGTDLANVAAKEKLVIAVAQVPSETPELSRAFQTLLIEELAKTGVKAVLPLPGPVEGAEAAARAAGADLLWRLTVRITGPELAVSGDRVPTWVNFWTGQDALRAPGGSAIGVKIPVDAQVLALANLASLPAKGALVTRFAVQALAKLPEKVVAVAVGDLDGDSRPEIAVLTSTQVVVLAANGQVVARRDLSALPRAGKPPREPAGALAIEPSADPAARPRLLAFSLGRSRGEALTLQKDALEPVAVLEQPALAVGAPGTLLGLGIAGKNLFAPEVRLGNRSALLPFGPVAVAGTVRPGGPAFVIANPDGAAVTLDADLKPTPLAGQLGSALALGELDGDGVVEVVATNLARIDGRIRLMRPGNPNPLFESEPIAANLVAAAAGDLDACGRDEAVLAGWTADGGTTLFVLGAQR
ncbi:MAG TPA: hypothetical protein VGK67_02320 [Myxococcales bacterium]